MNPILSVISIDLLLIFRVSLAFFWGWLWAAILQFTKQGQFLVLKRTWLTVVIGIGVDLLIAYAGDWWTVSAVIAASSIGIIVRSLINESQADDDPAINSYKLKQGLENAVAICKDLRDGLSALLVGSEIEPEQGQDKEKLLLAAIREIQTTKQGVSRELTRVHYLTEIITNARKREATAMNMALKRGKKQQ